MNNPGFNSLKCAAISGQWLLISDEQKLSDPRRHDLIRTNSFS